MKIKKTIISILCVLCLVCLYGCQKQKIYDMAITNIAEVRELMLGGENENVKATLISGFREIDYVVNGYCTEPIEFGVLTFNVLADIVIPENVSYVLTIGSVRYDGKLEHNPYNDTYVCDIQKKIEQGEIVFAKIIAGEFVENVELTTVTHNWVLNYKDALRTACSELSKELEEFVKDEQFCGECYIKILNDDELNNLYYWYVNFVSRFGKNYSVIIDPITAEILAKKTV